MTRKAEARDGVEMDAVSNTGFSELTELQGSQNSLDLILGAGRLEQVAPTSATHCKKARLKAG